nr:CocE/NonD family hydrolase [uncultured Holophaga sp.]
MATGLFLDGSITGLGYRTERRSGVLDAQGRFEYEPGETVSFDAAGIFLGSGMGRDFMSPADLVAEVHGDITRISHYQVTNEVRFLTAIGDLSPEVNALLAHYRYRINFVQDYEHFGADPAVAELMEKLGRTLSSVESARNLVRRCIQGIRKEANVPIPMRDGSFVLADVYRPLAEGRYPVVMCMGVFGKGFVNGYATTPEEIAFHEKAEDAFFESYGSPDTKKFLQGVFFQRMGPCFGSAVPIPRLKPGHAHVHHGPPPQLVPVSETFEQPCARDWVPRGYVVINMEERGVGSNPGDLKQFGVQSGRDYADGIEWAAAQSWSTGKVGLWGASYYAMTQYMAAQQRPKGLTAMIPIMGDYDGYRDYIYSGGGLYNRADNMNATTHPQDHTFMDHNREHPFWSEEAYGPEAPYTSTCDIARLDYPIWPVVEPGASLHGKGSSEAFIRCGSKNKKLLIVNDTGIHFWMYDPQYLDRFRAFFDKWLKGEENGIMEGPRVELQIRTGQGGYYWRRELDWPVPGTSYPRFYLDAQPGSVSTDGQRSGFRSLLPAPGADGQVSYDADVDRSEIESLSGVSFISEPMEEDMEIAGYIKAGLFVSSTTRDMELHLNLRVIDENGVEVRYSPPTGMCQYLPLGFGALKVSHRMQHPGLTRPDCPVYTHTPEDHQPLKPGQIVECEVGSFPTTGLIRKGWRIRLDLEPVGNTWIAFDEEAYRPGSQNTIHVGRTFPSYVQLPLLPKR